MIDKLKEYEIDFTDVVFIERIEQGYKEMLEDIQKEQENKNNSVSDEMKRTCVFARNFLNKIFGDGAGDKICGDSWSAKKHIEVIEYLVIKQKSANKELSARFAKYSPERLKK